MMAFAAAMRQPAQAGVEVYALGCKATSTAVEVKRQFPVDLGRQRGRDGCLVVWSG